MTDKVGDKFTDLLRKLVRVPKAEIDEQERQYQAKRKKGSEPAKPREMVTSRKRKAG